MKSAGILAIFFVAISFNALADDLALSDNPYAPVVERNIFGLVPIPVAPPTDTKPPDPPSKITPNGIMNLFGELQVLFKVSVPPKPGLPPHDQSYTMSVGERSDGIEVTKIDKQAGVITFDNHGVIQELSLSKAVASATPQPAQSTMPTPGFRSPGFRGRPSLGNNQSFGGNNYNSAATTTYGNNSNNNSAPSAPSYGAAVAPNGNNGQPQEQLSPEAQALLIEQNYMNAKANNDPTAPLFPSTPLRGQSDATLGGQSAPPPP